jgi:hypothetical protein
VAHQSLDDVNVLATAHEGSGIAMAPAVGMVPTGHVRLGPGLHDQVVQRPSTVATAEAPVAPQIGNKYVDAGSLGRISSRYSRSAVSRGRGMGTTRGLRPFPTSEIRRATRSTSSVRRVTSS